MAAHACQRCGLPSACTHGNWCDRHPWQAALAAVPLAIFALGFLVTYPLVVMPAVLLGGIGYVGQQEHRRRAALAARADYEHAWLMAQYQTHTGTTERAN